jgi:DegV family protein with EDD domain
VIWCCYLRGEKKEKNVPKIAIVTDSDASLPWDVAEKWNIVQVPVTVHFGEETFLTSVDIDDDSLFERINREGALPTTSAPAPGVFMQTFQDVLDGGADTVVCFCVSSEVSAIYSAACTARDSMQGKDVAVVDTRTLSMSQGFMALAAAEAAADGASKEEVIAYAQDVGARSQLFAALATLKYLAMSGRVGHVAAGIANVLNVKPILTIQDGKLDLLERVRTQGKAFERVIELTVEASAGKTIDRMAIIHVTAEDAAKQFEAQLRKCTNCPKDILLAEMTAGLSVHSGAGMVGVSFVTGI